MRRNRSEKGATLLESAVVLPFFLLLIIVTVELLRIAYIKLTLQHVVAEIARDALIHIRTETEIRDQTANRLRGLAVEFNPASDIITVCPANDATCTAGTVNLGQRGDFMVFRLHLAVDLFFVPGPGGLLTRSRFILSAQFLGRNEPP